MLTKHELEALERQLEDARQATEKTLKHLDEHMDFGSDVDHFEEEADEAEEFSNIIGVKRILQDKLEGIKTALEKLKKGGYGICEKCGKQIEIDVLHAAPESKLCRRCKR